MDWTQALTILGVFIAGFVYMMSRMDSHKKDIDQKFSHMDDKFDQVGNRIGKVENHLTALEAESKSSNQRITDLKTDINQRLSTIEGYLVPKKVYRFVDRVEERDEPKEE